MRLLRLKKYAIGAGGMLVLVIAIFLATGWGSAVAAQITNVFVTNDAAHAVPVHEQGTATVSVQGTAAVRSANEEVSVSHIFQDSEQFGGAVCEGTLYTVPAGKQLVVEWVGGDGQGTNVQPAGSLPSGQILGNLLNIPIVWEPGGGSGNTDVAASQPVHFTFPAGAVVGFQAAWQASTGCNFFMSLGGHLQPTP